MPRKQSVNEHISATNQSTKHIRGRKADEPIMSSIPQQDVLHDIPVVMDVAGDVCQDNPSDEAIGCGSANATMALQRINDLADAMKQGHLTERGDIRGLSGDWLDAVTGFNGIIDTIVSPINTASQRIDQMANGAIPPKIDDKFYGDINQLAESVNKLIDEVSALASNASTLSASASSGFFDTAVVENECHGVYNDIITGYANALSFIKSQITIINDNVNHVSTSELPELSANAINGEFGIISQSILALSSAIRQLSTDSHTTAQSIVNGDIDARPDQYKHSGYFCSVIQDIIVALDALTTPLKLMSSVAEPNSQVDNLPTLNTGHYEYFNKFAAYINTELNSRRTFTSDLNALIVAVQKGLLTARLNQSAHHGYYLKFAQDFNEVLDAVIGPLMHRLEAAVQLNKAQRHREELAKELSAIDTERQMLAARLKAEQDANDIENARNSLARLNEEVINVERHRDDVIRETSSLEKTRESLNAEVITAKQSIEAAHTEITRLRDHHSGEIKKLETERLGIIARNTEIKNKYDIVLQETNYLQEKSDALKAHFGKLAQTMSALAVTQHTTPQTTALSEKSKSMPQDAAIGNHTHIHGNGTKAGNARSSFLSDALTALGVVIGSRSTSPRQDHTSATTPPKHR